MKWELVKEQDMTINAIGEKGLLKNEIDSDKIIGHDK